ncbi:hypothetical protein FRB90_000494 [Tulasnella sp. 427]|nr:hypothetical protein FRB90_000494 [Tulasnella sp. 427]
MGPPTPNSANGATNQPGYNNSFTGQSDAAKASVSPPPAAVSLPPADLIGSAIVVTTNSGIRYEGILAPNEHSHPGINLRDAKDIVNPGSALIPTYFIPLQQVANWKKPDPPPAPSADGSKVLDTFRTDTDISGMSNKPRERELQAWKPDASAPFADTNGTGRDNITFGSAQPNGQWDQFAANEQLFGVTTDYNEDIYTTKINRNTSDYREKERKAQQLADEIQGAVASNPHLREERGQDDGVGNEEDKYGAVVRGPNAYVPPGARRTNDPVPAKASQPAAATPPIPKVSIDPPEPTAERSAEQPNGTSQAAPNGTSDQTTGTPPNGASGNKPKDLGVIASFRDFVSSEKERMTQKKQALVKHEKDKRLSELIEFSKSFKLKQPIPTDLVPILAKDEDKQKAIVEKASKDSEDRKARSIGVSIPPAAGTLPIPNAVVSPPTPAPASSKASNKISVIPPIPPFKGGPSKTAVPAGAKPGVTSPVNGPATAAASTKPGAAGLQKKAPIQMTIQKIPPFDPNKKRNLDPNAPTSSTPSNGATTPVSPSGAPTTASKLNANASAFNPKAPTFKPGGPSPAPSGSSDKPVDPPNPYFGVRRVTKTPVHIKDDFNPFRYNKVSDAGAVPNEATVWPFTGKKYMQMFPQIPHPPPVAPHQPAPPPYEEDPNAQAAQAARMGYPMMFYPYGPYAGAPPPPQHMMAAPNAAPPGGYMGSPYMQPMGYPQSVPPNGAPMYPPPPMPGMPPNQQYMPPPQPQGGFPPNAGHRGSMPPTPIPQHAYAAYHHQSPHMGHQHALPYGMMMPPTGPPVPHGYDAQQQGPNPMGVGH